MDAMTIFSSRTGGIMSIWFMLIKAVRGCGRMGANWFSLIHLRGKYPSYRSVFKLQCPYSCRISWQSYPRTKPDYFMNHLFHRFSTFTIQLPKRHFLLVLK